MGDPHPRPDASCADPSAGTESSAHQRHRLVISVDEGLINAPARVVSVAQALATYHGSGHSVSCLLQAHSRGGMGRGRLWVGPRTDRRAISTGVTAALIAASLRSLRLEATPVHVSGEREFPELPRILELLASRRVVVVTGPIAPADLAHHLESSLMVFDPESRDRAQARRRTAASSAPDSDGDPNGSVGAS